jgi:hypothetical protein
MRERLERGSNPQINAILEAGLGPIPARDRRVLIGDVSAHHAAVVWQSETDGERAVAGERANLDVAAGTHQAGQHGHQRALFRGNLHLMPWMGRRFLAEANQDRGLPETDAKDVCPQFVR